jgi:hypothetical protein
MLAAQMEQIKQSKTVDVQRGLMLVRYVAADDERRPPKVVVVVNPRDEKNIELVLNPDHNDATLWQPGSCLVVRAMRGGKLTVEVIPQDEDGSTAATVRLETLSQGEVTSASSRPAARPIVHAIEPGELRVLGHVAGIGDVTARADEWIAGPAAPARIEGLSIEWAGKPDDVEIRYAVKLARPHTVSGRMMELGGYAGTRGRALPVVGIMVELTGAGASHLRLSAEAAFLGAPVTRISGRQIEMAGPTGRESLVGFRLRLEDVIAPLQPALEPVRKDKSSGRVRVFRSRAAQNQLRSTLQSFCASVS